VKWHLVWLESASNELADGWLRADSATRAAITAASHAVEQRLVRDPLTEGESREEDARITFEGPLSVTFKVEPTDYTVVVVHIRVRRKPQN
jgi:hypothetical protein